MYFLDGLYLHHSTYFVSLYPYKEVILIKKIDCKNKYNTHK